MDDKKPSSRPVPAPAAAPAVAHRRRWLGSVIAVAALVAIVGLAWYLTHRAGTTADGAGSPVVAGARGPGGPGGARGAPPSTVGVATARRADIPVIIEAL